MPTVNNEKVSQLIGISATEIAAEDLFFVGDLSARQSKRLPAGELLTYVNISASINALTAVTAATASYVPASNVKGTVDTASVALFVISASHALVSNQSVTASFALNAPVAGTVGTASYLLYAGGFNGTASYAMSSSTAINVLTSSYLQYLVGVNNGTIFNAITASYVTTSSYAHSSSIAETSSFSSNAQYASSSILSTTASFLSSTFIYSKSPIKAWAWVTWSLGVTQPKIIEQYNISEIKYLNRFFGSSVLSPSYPSTWSQFGILFDEPPQNNRYMLVGDGYQPFGDPERAGVMMHPTYDSRSISGFTMSVITQGSNDFYLGIPGSYGGDEYGFVTFQIIGW